MADKTILVTGATGDTGGNTIDNLLKDGVAVRALVHKDDERAARLRRAGVEVVLGDLLDLDSVRTALEGVRAAYFCYPIKPGIIEATAFFAQAAREAQVEAIVNMSQKSSRRDAKSHAARNHWIAEQIFEWSGVPTTHLRPTYFAQWLLYPINGGTAGGKIRLPFGEGRHAPIAAEDQARLIAAILLNPEPHAGKVYPLYGPVEMNYREIAAAVSTALGRPIAYEPISLDEYRAHLESIKAFGPYLIQHLCETALDYKDGIFAGTNDVIERVTGEKPMGVEAFVARHRDRLSPSVAAA